MNQIRSPICSVMGHVDHGKSSVLDFIRNTNIVAREAGAITQAIGASIVPIATLRDICGKCLKDIKDDYFTVPGLLFIDTPGHAAFTNLRKRGGNLADIAILVVDINEGMKPQTLEAIQILRQYKTPFVVAANKVDLMKGFKSNPNQSVLKSIKDLPQDAQYQLDTKLYELVGTFHENGFESERFDRVTDYTKQVAIVPTSALKGDGLPELLMIVASLAQKFLEKSLHFDLAAPAKGTILEVKDEQGMGTSLDVILYDGSLQAGDTVVIGTTSEPIITKVRCLFEPAPHTEMMDAKSKYKAVKQVFAATGVKVSGPNMLGAVAGMPFRGVGKDQTPEEVAENMKEDIESVQLETDEEGIIVKADSLGGLEALVRILKEEGFTIRRATVGEISKKDVAEAQANDNPLDKIILGFNIKQTEEDVPVLTSNVIYTLVENFKVWQKDTKKALEFKKLEALTQPAKIEYLQNHTFRQSNPAIIGVEILAGTLKPNTQLMDADGKVLGNLKQVQKDNKSASEAVKGDQVAVAIEGVTAGRQIEEGMILYADLKESEFIRYKDAKDCIEGDYKALLKEIAEIKRKQNPVWGV
ncbi:MAG: translation initiation factor IF-2 [Candidatus Woesearchaeota archaeon]